MFLFATKASGESGGCCRGRRGGEGPVATSFVRWELRQSVDAQGLLSAHPQHSSPRALLPPSSAYRRLCALREWRRMCPVPRNTQRDCSLPRSCPYWMDRKHGSLSSHRAHGGCGKSLIKSQHRVSGGCDDHRDVAVHGGCDEHRESTPSSTLVRLRRAPSEWGAPSALVRLRRAPSEWGAPSALVRLRRAPSAEWRAQRLGEAAKSAE